MMGGQGFILFGGEDCVQRSIVCEACKVFEPIIEYQSSMQENRVFIIRYCINCQNFLGGKLEGLGGSFPPTPPSR